MSKINTEKLSLHEINWIHDMTFPDGTKTGGKWKMNEKEYGLDRVSFKNKRVLDIGCLDGLYTFYAENKGASEVLAIDINEEQFGRQKYKENNWSSGFLYAHKKMKSRSKYVFPYSLYDMKKDSFGSFDIVLYLGVNYHILHPILALEKINEVMNKKGILIFESEMSNTFTKFYHERKYKSENSGKKEKVSNASMRILEYYKKAAKLTMLEPKDIGKAFASKIQTVMWGFGKFLFDDKEAIYKRDISNFWIMDAKTMERMLDVSGFSIIHKITQPFGSRITYICKKSDDVHETYAAKSIYSDRKTFLTNVPKFKNKSATTQ